jgi:hypothetical protein
VAGRIDREGNSPSCFIAALHFSQRRMTWSCSAVADGAFASSDAMKAPQNYESLANEIGRRGVRNCGLCVSADVDEGGTDRAQGSYPSSTIRAMCRSIS